MLTGVEAKAGNIERQSDSLEIWTCGCTVVGSVSSISVRCLSCGNSFKKVNKKNKLAAPKKGKLESVKIELVNNIKTVISEGGDQAPCPRCEDAGEVKVFTQEWDRIKSHLSPCPVCRSQEWLDWSAGRRIVLAK